MALSVGEHLRCPEGQLINGKYKVLKEVGCGNFAKVYKCLDVTSPSRGPVAVKVLKKEYANDAAFENDVLRALNQRGAESHKIVHMIDHFSWNRYPCFVFALKGPTLRSRRMGVAKGHTTMREVRALAHEMLSTLAYLHHEARIIHTDLKPENILLDHDDVPESAGLGRGWTIADFGSASFYRPERLDSDLISTRPYRAPEVVLGMPWSYKADVWSMACIIFEAYHGARLFEVHEDQEHLLMFERRIGAIPVNMSKLSKHFRRFFNPNGSLIKPRTELPSNRSMSEILREEPEFCDFLMRMLEIDSDRRYSAQQALEHPFLRGYSAAGMSSAAAAPTASSVPAFSSRVNPPLVAPASGRTTTFDYRAAPMSSRADGIENLGSGAMSGPAASKPTATSAYVGLMAPTSRPHVPVLGDVRGLANAQAGQQIAAGLKGGIPSARAGVPGLRLYSDMPAAGRPSAGYPSSRLFE